MNYCNYEALAWPYGQFYMFKFLALFRLVLALLSIVLVLIRAHLGMGMLSGYPAASTTRGIYIFHDKNTVIKIYFWENMVSKSCKLPRLKDCKCIYCSRSIVMFKDVLNYFRYRYFAVG